MAEPQQRERKDDGMSGLYPYALAVTTVLLIIAGIYFLLRLRTPSTIEILLPTATPAVPVALTANISGAVARPGVYTLTANARVTDLVQMAGGLSDSADQSRVNLAQRIRDEDHIHVPAVGEALPSPPFSVAATGGPINVNTATAVVLEGLPGIGPAKASAIIQYRESNGPFRRVDDLLLVPGIGPATLHGMRDLITVGSP